MKEAFIKSKNLFLMDMSHYNLFDRDYRHNFDIYNIPQMGILSIFIEGR